MNLLALTLDESNITGGTRIFYVRGITVLGPLSGVLQE
jgi:hypothetical protein